MQVEQSVFDQWDKLGLRAAYGQMLLHLANSDPTLFALSADLGRSSGLDRYASTFPDRYLGTGIAEQNMVGVASGLAASGFNVFASSFAPFITMRAGDQVRMNLGYMGLPVTLVGLASGLSLGFLGSSHFGLEDLSVMGSIPGIEIVSPADSRELFSVLVYASKSRKPLYIRLTGASNLTRVSPEGATSLTDKQLRWLRPDHDGISIVTSGVMAATCLKVAESLFSETGISIGVLQANWLRPFSAKGLFSSSKVETWFAVEEHSIRGGLGSEILRNLEHEDFLRPKVITLGIEEIFPRGSTYLTALFENGLDETGIINKIKLELKK
jgi:transketolase